jgi:hypothetical protein
VAWIPGTQVAKAKEERCISILNREKSMTNQPSNVASLSQSARNEVVSAIRQASVNTGVDFSYLMQKAEAESSFNPQAQASTSSARGLFQFIDQTWLETLDRHGDAHGLGKAADLITRNAKGEFDVKDPALRREILAMRDNPRIAAIMAAELAKDNQASLEQSLGHKVGNTEMYMAHFLGAGGAARFLATLDDNPHLKAANVVPAAANANQSVFYENGKSLTVDQVYAHFAEKFGETGTAPRVGAPATPAAPAAIIAAVNENEFAAAGDTFSTFRSDDLSIKTPLQSLPLFALAILEAMRMPGEAHTEKARDEALGMRHTV